ncbi:phage terminase large subunit [Bradyrhizobium japonicum]|uniref:PBSX family phage terminase large subunit n=1 Tax=Bradyrhizobium japonicum TaxID=375 RepID=UPI0021683129|nr:phage terminase large subunit [Bradyrhizobium japonicum]MCS3495137.1 phage terminase large subunit [Bradyrhizobium japonicum]MCS3962700.1 phage terminase large subunit [Bradyrhizobium japonicum]MCS3995016.1 phage terminase large subunit [Bradyrhizobium japonicum]
MSILKIPTAKIFEPLLKPARYKGVYGGRGSGKSHFFGELLVETCQAERGTLAVCIREAQRTLAQSSKRLIEGKIASLGLGHGFKLFSDKIETPADGLIIFRGLQDHTADSIKSLEGFRIAWIDEAQSLSARSLALLRPTIRAKDSELWASWNPRRKSDAIDDFLRSRRPDSAVVVKANWRDNPWFPDVLEEERLLDQKLYPERYDHIWEGEYARAFEGAYFASLLSEARAQGRIGKISADPLLPLRAFIDIGGAGAAADAFTIWVVQWVGSEIRLLDYYESVGQVLAFHVNWLRARGYDNAILYLPHDGIAANNITGKRYEDHLREAGFAVEPPVKNQGPGAAMMRIEALRRLGPQLWFNEDATEPGREALGFYHERKDETRNIGLGPEHDWSSHAADALGLMAICYEQPGRVAAFNRPIRYAEQGWV